MPPDSSNTFIYFLLFAILLSLADEVRRQKIFLRRPGYKIAVIAVALIFVAETTPIFVKNTEAATWGYTPHTAGYSGTYYYLTDHQGGYNKIIYRVMAYSGSSNTMMYNNVESATTYKPYGEIYQSESGGVRHYTGKELDYPDEGLYYYGARYYDPDLGMFLQPDPAMQFPSPYLYTGGNPVNRTDPTGLISPNNEEGEKNQKFDDAKWTPGWSAESTTTTAAYNGNIVVVNGEQAQPTFPNIIIESDNSVIYNYGSYSEVWSGGTRAWRNNNPGNIRSGNFSNKQGGIGSAGGFAVFPNYQTGFNALVNLLQTSAYNQLTLNQAISRYAPNFENDTSNYQNFVGTTTGIDSNALINTLTTQQIISIANTIQLMEGYLPGRITIYYFGQ